MKKIGAVSGKFRILHNAHKEYILKATLYVDELHIFIVDDQSIKRFSDVYETKLAIIEILKGIDIEYYIHIAPKLDSMIQWDNYVINKLGHDQIIMFNSKEEYTNVKLATGYINCQHALSISASEIEKNPYQEHNFTNVAAEYMPYLNKKIAINGVKKTGKTQMIKKIAKIYQTNSTKDMRKEYINEKLNGKEQALTIEEIKIIISEQIVENNQANHKAKRFLIIDNDYATLLLEVKKLYEQQLIDEDTYKKQCQYLKMIWQEQKNDLTILLRPSQDNKEYDLLKEIYDENKVKYSEITNKDYVSSFKKIEELINEIL